MRWPFLNDVIGMTLGEYAFANGTVGVIASFVATILGGRLIARDGLRRWIWPFVLPQNVLNLLYIGLAWRSVPRARASASRWRSSRSSSRRGLGTAVFMVYLMRCCDPAHQAPRTWPS